MRKNGSFRTLKIQLSKSETNHNCYIDHKGSLVMGQVLDITALISINKTLIEKRNQLKSIEEEVLSHGDGTHEGDKYRLIVKDGKIEVIEKTDPEVKNEEKTV